MFLRGYWSVLGRRFGLRDDLLRWQDQQVQRFLRRVLPRSPFYQHHFQGLDLTDWPTFPTINKQVMMDNFDRLNTLRLKQADCFTIALQAEQDRDFRPTLGGVTVGLSSGTSGSRGLFLVSPAERYRWAGVMVAKVLPQALWTRQRVAFFLRANSNLYTTVQSRWLQFQYFDLLDPLEQHLHTLNRLQPTLLVAPPSMLRWLAQAKAEDRLHLQPHKLISVAEVLDPLDQAFIEAAFEQPVHQVYQATEGFLGSTCRYGTLHLTEDVVAIQKAYLDVEQRKFSPIITDFNRTSQPIIRYRLNDILTERATPCPCGSVLTAIEQIEGRCDDLFYFVAQSASRLIPIFPDFIRRVIISHTPNLIAYLARQRERNLIEIALEVPPPYQTETEAAVLANLHQLCERLDCHMPTVRFVAYQVQPGARKFKRVEQTCSELSDLARTV